MRTVTLDVEALQVEPLTTGRMSSGDWPCPFCGERKPFTGSYSARVRNRTGMAMERWVLVCAECMRSIPKALQ